MRDPDDDKVTAACSSLRPRKFGLKPRVANSRRSWGEGGRAEMGDEVETLACRFPQHASTIRRLQARDPSFHSICDDYDDAQRALKHWQAAGQAAPERVAEYRQILQELEAEALAILDAFEGK